MKLQNRRVVLGVSGGIAAYKAIEVCRRLVDEGAHVSPVLTDAATKMVGPTTFNALGSERAKTSLWNDSDVIPHTKLGQTADLILVCPATARCIADLRIGRSGDLLLATLLATEAPIIVCPAMHTEMWNNAAVQENIAVLRNRGVTIVGPGTGLLAGGDEGPGRLAEVDEIVGAAIKQLTNERSAARRDYSEQTVVVTAGGTREPIDPVRYISNRSSGRQGHAIAEVAASRGANVVLITASRLPATGVEKRIEVDTAAEMADAVAGHRDSADVIVMAAAVADFRVAEPEAQKIKKADGTPTLTLIANEDILAGLARTKRPGQVIVGFAAETQNVDANATKKLKDKGADLIVANDVTDAGVGFDHDTNAVSIIESDGTRHRVGLTSKHEVASAVLDVAIAYRTSNAKEPC